MSWRLCLQNIISLRGKNPEHLAFFYFFGERCRRFWFVTRVRFCRFFCGHIAHFYILCMLKVFFFEISLGKMENKMLHWKYNSICLTAATVLIVKDVMDISWVKNNGYTTELTHSCTQHIHHHVYRWPTKISNTTIFEN